MVAASQPYDDRDGWIWMDGKLVPWRDAKIHVVYTSNRRRIINHAVFDESVVLGRAT